MLRREPSVFDMDREPFADGIAGDFDGESRVILAPPYVAWGRVEGDEDKPLRYAATMSANLELVVTAVNHYDRLLAAARAVIERWDHDELRNRHIDALRAAVEGTSDA